MPSRLSKKAPSVEALAARLPPEKSASVSRLVSALRSAGYSPRTEKIYLDWVVRFLSFFDDCDLDDITGDHLRTFLSHLGLVRGASASTQRQALNALTFYFEDVIGSQVDLDEIQVDRRGRKLPEVLSREEMGCLLNAVRDPYALAARLMYGAGLRLTETVRLRVRDVDFKEGVIRVCDDGVQAGRVVPLPRSCRAGLKSHLQVRRRQFSADRRTGVAVSPPEPLAQDHPEAAESWEWQYVFGSSRVSRNPNSDHPRRDHIHPTGLQKAIQRAAEEVGIGKRVNAQILRHSFALHLLEAGYDVRVVQKLMGHAHPSSTMIYIPLLGDTPRIPAISPLDFL